MGGKGEKILITGGAGFIGFHMARHLSGNGNLVTLCDVLDESEFDDEFKKLIMLYKLNYIKCDLTDASETSKLNGHYDYIYHFAAINGTKKFYKIPHKILTVNILTTLNILNWIKEKGCGKIIFSSSSEVYAGGMDYCNIAIPSDENVPLVISDPFNPRFSYAASKIVDELLFINYAREYKIDMNIVRYHNIYGPRMGLNHVIPEFIVRVFKKEEPFKIFGSNNTRAFCYIDDAISATEQIMLCKEASNEIFHVGNPDEEIKIIDLAKKIFVIAGVSVNIQDFPAPLGSVMRRCPDIRKLNKFTGFKPKISLDEGLRIVFEWYSNNMKR